MAQTANGGGGVPNARVQAVHAEWRRLAQSEVNCVDQSLRGQRSSLWSLIQRGIDPSDSAVAKIRAACRTQAQVKVPNYVVAAQKGSQALAASSAEGVTDKAAAEKAAADKAIADAIVRKAVADKVAAEKAAADKIAADQAAAAKAAADKAAAAKAAADKAAADKANADAERAKADAAKAEAERPRQESETAAADSAFASVAAELSSFIYGLVSGATLVALGGAMILFLRRKRNAAGAQSNAVAIDGAGSDRRSEFDRLVTAVLDEQKRRDTKRIAPVEPAREQQIDEAVLH